MEVPEESPAHQLQQQVPSIVRAVHRQMREKSIKTRQGCFALLTQLTQVLPGALTEHIAALVPGIQFSLGGDRASSSNMKIDTLTFIQHLLGAHQHQPKGASAVITASSSAFLPHAPVLVPTVLNAVDDQFYKIASEALLVLETLVRVLRPVDTQVDQPGDKWVEYVQKVRLNDRQLVKTAFYNCYSYFYLDLRLLLFEVKSSRH